MLVWGAKLSEIKIYGIGFDRIFTEMLLKIFSVTKAVRNIALHYQEAEQSEISLPHYVKLHAACLNCTKIV